jgi:hypothetical protein
MGWRDEAVRKGVYVDGIDDAYKMETRSGLLDENIDGTGR